MNHGSRDSFNGFEAIGIGLIIVTILIVIFGMIFGTLRSLGVLG